MFQIKSSLIKLHLISIPGMILRTVRNCL